MNHVPSPSVLCFSELEDRRVYTLLVGLQVLCAEAVFTRLRALNVSDLANWRRVRIQG